MREIQHLQQQKAAKHTMLARCWLLLVHDGWAHPRMLPPDSGLSVLADRARSLELDAGLPCSKRPACGAACKHIIGSAHVIYTLMYLNLLRHARQ